MHRLITIMFPTPMITDDNLIRPNKRNREMTLRPEQGMPPTKFICASCVPMDVDDVTVYMCVNAHVDVPEIVSFIFLPIPQLIRSDVHIPY